jgi:hypothetical protein
LPNGPFIAFNGQKKIDLTENFALAAGTQWGVVPSRNYIQGGTIYLNSVYLFEDIGLNGVLGAYYATENYFGEGARNHLFQNDPFWSQLGFQGGLEKSIIKDKFFFQTEYYGGLHNFGQTLIGISYYLQKNWFFTAGYQMPLLHSKTLHAAVFELTYIPK